MWSLEGHIMQVRSALSLHLQRQTARNKEIVALNPEPPKPKSARIKRQIVNSQVQMGGAWLGG